MIGLFHSITLKKDADTPLYIQLYEKIREMILDGILPGDLRLPSIRQMAKVLNVNQVTVVSSYKLLEKEGYAYSKPGSGTYISNDVLISNVQRGQENNPISDELYQQDDIALINNGQIKINENTINFASATPTPDLFPVQDFKLALNEVLDRDKGNAFGYQESQGYYPLRQSICTILQRNHIQCTPEKLQIISGAQQGIDIISKAFLKQGDYIITESPTYTGAIAVFKSRGAQIADIEMEEDGPNLNILEYNLKKYRPKLIYTIPSFQNPTGNSYSNEKRKKILELAQKYHAYIIEDDYVSDLDFEHQGFMPLKSLDQSNRVIFIKSFSKIFMPGLRLGFMIVPSSLMGNILEAKHTTDISTSGLIQRAFDMYIQNGFWGKHYGFMYEVYKERYLKITQALDRNLEDGMKYKKPGGGLNIWLSLPYGFAVRELIKRCASEEIVFAPGQIFYSGNTSPQFNHIRLSFASVYAEQIEKGIESMFRIMKEFQHKHASYRNLPVL